MTERKASTPLKGKVFTGKFHEVEGWVVCSLCGVYVIFVKAEDAEFWMKVHCWTSKCWVDVTAERSETLQ